MILKFIHGAACMDIFSALSIHPLVNLFAVWAITKKPAMNISMWLFAFVSVVRTKAAWHDR